MTSDYTTLRPLRKAKRGAGPQVRYTSHGSRHMFHVNKAARELLPVDVDGTRYVIIQVNNVGDLRLVPSNSASVLSRVINSKTGQLSVPSLDDVSRVHDGSVWALRQKKDGALIGTLQEDS